MYFSQEPVDQQQNHTLLGKVIHNQYRRRQVFFQTHLQQSRIGITLTIKYTLNSYGN